MARLHWPAIICPDDGQKKVKRKLESKQMLGTLASYNDCAMFILVYLNSECRILPKVKRPFR